MRRIAVITDIHANLPALKAALNEIEVLGCEKIIHTGDLIGIGPHPRECFELMLESPNVSFVKGNHDEIFARGLPNQKPEEMGEGRYRHYRWTHNQLDPQWREIVGKWPYAITKTCGGIRFAFMHYGWNVASQRFAEIVEDPSRADLARMFGGKDQDLIFYGHDHTESDQIGLARYINPGSLGCSNDPFSRFVTVTLEQNGDCSLEKHAVPYDPQPVLEDLEKRRVPQRELFYEIFYQNLLQQA